MKKLIVILVIASFGLVLSAQGLDSINIGKPHSNNGLGDGERLYNAWLKINDHIAFTNLGVYPIITLKSSRATGLNSLNATNYDVNKIRTTWSEQVDTASVSLTFSTTGNPTLIVRGKTGNQLFKVDSLLVYEGVNPISSTYAPKAAPVFTGSVTMAVGDTTVVKAYGKMIFKTSDSTLYLCKYIRPTGKKCWFKVDN